MGKGIFLSGACCLLPIIAVGFVMMIVVMSMFFGGLIMLIIGIALLISIKKKQQNVKLYQDERNGEQKHNTDYNDNNQNVKKSSISDDIEYSNELKVINVLNIVTKILIILGIIFMIPFSVLYINGKITNYKNSSSYQYNLPKTNYDYDEGRDYLIKGINEDYKEKNIPMDTTLSFFDEFDDGTV